jgi:hypothetical protein
MTQSSPIPELTQEEMERVLRCGFCGRRWPSLRARAQCEQTCAAERDLRRANLLKDETP